MEYRKKSLLPFISSALLLFCGITAANAQSPQKIARKALASTVLLVMEDTNGQLLHLAVDSSSAMVRLLQIFMLLKGPREVTRNW